MANLQRFYLKKDEHTYWTLPVEASTTAQDVCDSIASKLELRSGSCTLLEAKLDKGAIWEREIAGNERVMAVQSKWNPKKYAEKFVVVKPKVVRQKENRNSIPSPHPPPPSSNAPNADELKFVEESWKEKAYEEMELLRRELDILAEANSDLQQQLFAEKQKRNAAQNPNEVVKQLMEAEQKIDDLKLTVSDLQDQSNRLEIENNDLFNELTQAAHAIGGPYEEKITAIKRTPRNPRNSSPRPSSSSSSSNIPSTSSPANPRTYFEGNRSDSPLFGQRENMTSADYDRNLEVASIGLDLAELQKSQRARERALDESKQKLREELEMSKQRRSDVLKESKQVLLEELEAIKSKSDLSKKKFEDSLLASRKKLEHELDSIEKKRRAQEDVRWSRPMSGYSSTLSPSKQDGFSVSPSSSPTPTRRELFTPSSSSSLFDSPNDKYSHSPLFGSPSASPSPSRNERYTTTTPERSSTPDRFSSSLTSSSSSHLSPKVERFTRTPEGSPSSYRLSDRKDSPLLK